MTENELNKIINYRKYLKKLKKDYEKKLKCKHIYGNIMFTTSGTEAGCPICNESLYVTHSEDGSYMSQKHVKEANAKKKTNEENKWFREKINRIIKAEIRDIEFCLKEMKIITFEKKLFRKPLIKILEFRETIYPKGQEEIKVVSGRTYYGNEYLFWC